jgi:hypothetical protein
MALTIEKIKDEEARAILLQVRKLGEEVVESTLGHKRFEANSLLIIGLAKLIAQNTKQNVRLQT